MGTELTTTKQTACDLAAEGKTLACIAEELGIDRTVLYRWLHRDPTFKEQFDSHGEIGALSILDQMREVPFNPEHTPARARVIADNLHRYVETRYPQRFGKQLNVNLKTLDMNKALEQARERAGIVTQVIDSTAEVVESSTDGESFDVDPFS